MEHLYETILQQIIHVSTRKDFDKTMHVCRRSTTNSINFQSSELISNILKTVSIIKKKNIFFLCLGPNHLDRVCQFMEKTMKCFELILGSGAFVLFILYDFVHF